MDSPAETASRVPLHVRAWMGIYRRLAIPLQIRSHRRNARQVAPRGDLVHGMAFMGIPVALTVGSATASRSSTTPATSTSTPGTWRGWAGRRAGCLAAPERGWASGATSVITVNDAYADVLASRWPVEPAAGRHELLVPVHAAVPRERRFHEALGLPATSEVVLYHGGLFPWRGIEQLIEAIRDVPDATLVLMGYGVLEPTLRAWAADPRSAAGSA